MTTSDHHAFNVADLVGRPGSSRPIDVELDVPDGLDLPLAQVVGPLRLHGVVESVVEGLLVRGTLTAKLQLDCARCLEPVRGRADAEVAELFTDPSSADADEVEAGYEIHDDRLDLDTLVRDALVPAVPLRPLCDDACQGLCPSCGINRNDASCQCVDEPSDARWAALQDLHLDQ